MTNRALLFASKFWAGGLPISGEWYVTKDDGTRTLVVPNIKNADSLDFARFWAAYEDVVRKARTNKLTADDFAGTTISLKVLHDGSEQTRSITLDTMPTDTQRTDQEPFYAPRRGAGRRG